MADSKWVFTRIAKHHQLDKKQNIRACHAKFLCPDEIDGHMPDIYITTIRRLYEIKKNVQDVKDSIGQLKSLMNYPRMKSYFIVVCEDLERKEKNELKKFLMDNNVINARIESWKEIFDKLGIGVN